LTTQSRARRLPLQRMKKSKPAISRRFVRNQQKSTRFPFIDSEKLRHAAVVCHRNADADAFLSAYALTRLLQSVAPHCEVDIGTPGGVTVLTAKLAGVYQASTVEEGEKDYDLYVAVDVGDAELLKGWLARMKASRAVKVLVDHHPLRDREVYDHVVVHEGATSAAEVVYSLFEELGVKPDRMTAQALLEGILFDSQHLLIASEKALRAVVALMDRGADIEVARKALSSPPDYGEVVAKLKGTQRMKLFKLGDWVAAVTEVGSFQAQVARALIYLGADVAVVTGASEGETRASLRSGQRFFNATSVKLGTDVVENVTAKLGGRGGGHPTAASCTCSGTVADVQKACVDRVAELLSVQPHELK
jgi:phosphoesterase RecJ-like protein